MTSPARIAAARANGRKSRGPTTPQGKANSSRNSLRHGLRAKTLFDDGRFEDQRLAILTSFMDELQPQSEIEYALVEAMARTHWSRIRIRDLETQLFNSNFHRSPENSTETAIVRVARSFSQYAPALDLLSRFDCRFARQFTSASARLTALREKK